MLLFVNNNIDKPYYIINNDKLNEFDNGNENDVCNHKIEDDIKICSGDNPVNPDDSSNNSNNNDSNNSDNNSDDSSNDNSDIPPNPNPDDSSDNSDIPPNPNPNPNNDDGSYLLSITLSIILLLILI